jgi:hypothetical protein
MTSSFHRWVSRYGPVGRCLPLAWILGCSGGKDSHAEDTHGEDTHGGGDTHEEDPCAMNSVYGASGTSYATLQEAVDGELEGGTVYICAGEVPSAVWVSHNITIEGAGLTETTLEWSTREDASEVGYPVVAVAPAAQLTVRDLAIRGGNRYGCEATEDCVYLGGGLLVNDGATVTAERVWFDGSSADYGAGIALGGASAQSSLSLTDCELTSNLASESGGAIMLWGSAAITVTNTSFGTGGTANAPDDVSIYAEYPTTPEYVPAISSYDYDDVVSFSCDTTSGACE